MIDLQSLAATSLNYAHGTLTLSDAGHAVDTLAIAGNLVSADFGLRSDGHGGTDLYGHNPYVENLVASAATEAAGRLSVMHSADAFDYSLLGVHPHAM